MLEKDRAQHEEAVSKLVCLRSSYKQAKQRGDQKALEQIRSEAEAAKSVIRAHHMATIAELKRDEEERLTDDIMLLLCYLNDAVNVEGLTEMQMEIVAADILENYSMLRIEDIGITIKKGITGKYGKLYGKIDAVDVLTWIGLYFEELRTHRQSIQDRVHSSLSGSPVERSDKRVWKAEIKLGDMDFYSIKKVKNNE